MKKMKKKLSLKQYIMIWMIIEYNVLVDIYCVLNPYDNLIKLKIKSILMRDYQ